MPETRHRHRVALNFFELVQSEFPVVAYRRPYEAAQEEDALASMRVRRLPPSLDRINERWIQYRVTPDEVEGFEAIVYRYPSGSSKPPLSPLGPRRTSLEKSKYRSRSFLESAITAP